MTILKQKTPGFTLIELLVVISVIGLLASVILIALNGVRAKARDAKRKADLRQISTALEFYYDKNGSYPLDTFGGFEQSCKTTTNDIGRVVAEGFMSSLPCDSVNSGSGGTGLGYYFEFGDCGGTSCNGYCAFSILEGPGQYTIGTRDPCVGF